MGMVFCTRDREAGNIIDIFATEEMAIEAIKNYEAEDKNDGNYTEDFYEAVQISVGSLPKSMELMIIARDNCTRKEAERFLLNGAGIYLDSDKASYVKDMENAGIANDEAVKEWNKLSVTEYHGIRFHIEYII